jgi:hypothetical protein
MRLLVLPSGATLEHGTIREPASAFGEEASIVNESIVLDVMEGVSLVPFGVNRSQTSKK